jgi:hypothetical protein
VNLIYQETRSEFTDQLDEDSLIIFLQDLWLQLVPICIDFGETLFQESLSVKVTLMPLPNVFFWMQLKAV